MRGLKPIVKKEEQKPQSKQLSYADMYKMLNPEREETAEQKANRERKERTNFNSIKVRLKLASGLSSTYLSYDFNSIKVRLKRIKRA